MQIITDIKIYFRYIIIKTFFYYYRKKQIHGTDHIPKAISYYLIKVTLHVSREKTNYSQIGSQLKKEEFWIFILYLISVQILDESKI